MESLKGRKTLFCLYFCKNGKALFVVYLLAMISMQSSDYYVLLLLSLLNTTNNVKNNKQHWRDLIISQSMIKSSFIDLCNVHALICIFILYVYFRLSTSMWAYDPTYLHDGISINVASSPRQIKVMVHDSRLIYQHNININPTKGFN